MRKYRQKSLKREFHSSDSQLKSSITKHWRPLLQNFQPWCLFYLFDLELYLFDVFDSVVGDNL